MWGCPKGQMIQRTVEGNEEQSTMATIFDNVEIQPPKQGPPGYLTLAMLVANCWLEAEKVKDERLARERGAGAAADEAPALETIMERAGLKIPGIKDAITQMMGGGDEVQQAMGLIDRSPDPAKLLQGLVGQAVQQHLASAGFAVKQPAAAAATGPERPAAPVVPLFRPEFTREAREAAKANAARSAATGAATPAAAPSHPATAVPPSLVERVERRIDALRQKTQKFQTMLGARLASAEARIAALQEELRRLTQGLAAEVSAPAAVPTAQQELPRTPPPTEAAASELPAETKEPLPAATEAEVIRSVELVEAFAEELTEQQADSIERVEAVEQKVSVLEEAVRAARAARQKASGDG